MYINLTNIKYLLYYVESSYLYKIVIIRVPTNKNHVVSIMSFMYDMQTKQIRVSYMQWRHTLPTEQKRIDKQM